MQNRRAFLTASLALAAQACKRCDPSAGPAPVALPPDGGSADGSLRDLQFPASAALPEGQRALLMAPPDAAKLPLLIALHGRGEAGRGLDVGADAWPNNYRLIELQKRALSPPLSARDLRDMASPARLAKLNESLEKTPYQGLVVACPYTPDLPDKSPAGAQSYARFLLEDLVPRARKELGATDALPREKLHLDGVSMGGRLALLIGLTHPEAFGAVGVLQPAIRVDEAAMIAKLAKEAMAKAAFKLRLVSSDEDPFLPAVRAASQALKAEGVDHELLVIPGEHGYEFNRGPGGMEMLLWHERVARGLPPP